MRGAKKLIFLTICDVKSGRDEAVYSRLEKLRGGGGVTPLVIGRLFEDADVMLLLHSAEMESLDDYLVKNVRSVMDIQELIVVPIYEFRLLSSFDFMVEPELERKRAKAAPAESEELLFFVVEVDVAPTKDRAVYDRILSIAPSDENVPLMTGHTFHSKEFDLVLFFLSRSLENAWEFVKGLRAIDGVWDTEVKLIAHFEGLATLKRFKEFVSTMSARGGHRCRVGEKKN